jgi:hypothetical protein
LRELKNEPACLFVHDQVTDGFSCRTSFTKEHDVGVPGRHVEDKLPVLSGNDLACRHGAGFIHQYYRDRNGQGDRRRSPRQRSDGCKRYPERVQAVRRDLGELNNEIARLERERAVSDRVVELVDADLAALGPAVQQAVAAAGGRAARAAVTFDDEVLSLHHAKSKLAQIERTKIVHLARAADAQHKQKYLRQQEGRFNELLGQLETEHMQLTTQLVQLEREVESIARNERLIELLNKRQRTLDNASRYEAVSLGEITAELTRIRTEQEARLDLLAATRESTDYEDMATMQLTEEHSPRATVLTVNGQ